METLQKSTQSGHGAEQNTHDLADRSLRTDAMWQLSERLKEGKRVGFLTLWDLIASDLAGPNCAIAEEKALEIIFANEADRSARIEQWKDDVIERHLLAHPDLIEEEAAMIDAEEPEEA